MKSLARHDESCVACDDRGMQHRRKGALISVTLLLTLAACGSGSDGATPPATDEPPAATEAPASDGTTGADPADVPATNAPEPTSAEAPEADEPIDTEATPAAEEAPAEPVVTAAPEAAAPAEPVVGGRLFATDVQPASAIDSNPFPDLVVDDIGKDAKVNIANILPSDRPVLLWAWAPH